MAADPTTTPPAKGGRSVPQVEQPPRTIVRGGETVDISGLTGEALYQALINDEERWGYSRLSAETGRTVVRIRKWVHNVNLGERTGRAPDDKTFIAPEGYFEGSPWWHAGVARKVLMKIGVMTREGVAIPHKPTGRSAGAKDQAPRKSWENAPVRDTGASIYREYLKLTTRRRAPLSDRQARAELCASHNLSRTQLARRINEGKAQVEGPAAVPVEVDKAALRARLTELVAEKRAAGYSERGANERARTALAEETGLTRRQIAGYVLAAAAEETAGKTG